MKLKPDECPNCGYKVYAATELRGKKARPEIGDFSLCLSCGVLNRFNEQLLLVTASPENEAELTPEQFAEVRRAQSLIRRRGPIG